MRVVFGGSAKTTTGISLNDALLVGPTIQADLFSLLIRFRQHPIVITGGIEKMYRQFLVRKEDRKYQRIIWNNQIYELNRVTFGLAAAPFLAIRCLHQLAIDEGSNYPVASSVLKEDFYVDDVLTGARTIDEAINIRKQLTEILSKAKLTIRQWASNEPAVLHGLSEKSINQHLQLGDTTTLKKLGIAWDAKKDTITYTVHPKDLHKITKRTILAETAKIFDPLDLLAPVIIVAKMIMQKLWSLKVDWDESLPQNIHSEWLNFYNELRLLNSLTFQRTIIKTDVQKIELHGFADASERAYGACLYLRTINRQGQIYVMLLCSKSRVAPLKTMTIPRLELCAAQLLALLSKTTIAALKIRIDSIYLWTDSSIILHWLNTSPNQLKTFVANRVCDIQEKTKIGDWRHVRTHDNPADLVSRGILPTNLITSPLWKAGPAWLKDTEINWPKTHLPGLKELPERRKGTCLRTTIRPSGIIYERFSTIGKLVRSITYCLRFLTRPIPKGYLTIKELNSSLSKILHAVQQETFSNEIKILVINKNEKLTNQQLLKLSPFIDEKGLIRVGGRLSHSELPFEAKHPIILPKDHYVTKLLIEQEHKTHLHSGVQQTLYGLRRKYWPIDGRSQVWKVLKSCINCRKQRPLISNYLMCNLPPDRITQARPFSKVGIVGHSY